MTAEEFYAQALIAAFPVAVGKSPSRFGKEQIMELAHEYASLSTQTFKGNRGTFED
jgi:hypothetical protein